MTRKAIDPDARELDVAEVLGDLLNTLRRLSATADVAGRAVESIGDDWSASLSTAAVLDHLSRETSDAVDDVAQALAALQARAGSAKEAKLATFAADPDEEPDARELVTITLTRMDLGRLLAFLEICRGSGGTLADLLHKAQKGKVPPC